MSKVYDTDGDDLAGGLYIDMQVMHCMRVLHGQTVCRDSVCLMGMGMM